MTLTDEVTESSKLNDEIDGDDESDDEDQEDIWQNTSEDDHDGASLLPSLEGITPAAIIQARQGQLSVMSPSPSFDSSTSPTVVTGSSKTK